MMLLSIDEAIEHTREVANSNKTKAAYDNEFLKRFCTSKEACIKCAEEHEQIAEWLEELKEYRKHIELTAIPEQYKLGFQDGIVNGFENGYNKAIDDFVHKCDKRCGFYTVGNKILTREDVLLIARELKEGREQC